jgi:hypothetical protein
VCEPRRRELHDTDLRGADLRGANISDADFTDAQVDDKTNLEKAYDGRRRPKGLGAHLPPITQHGEWEGPQECLGHRKYDSAERKGDVALMGSQA